MRVTSNLTKTLVIALFFVTFAHVAAADENKEPSYSKVDVAPFCLWLVPVDGDVAIGPTGNSFTLDFGDVLTICSDRSSSILRHFIKKNIDYSSTRILSILEILKHCRTIV